MTRSHRTFCALASALGLTAAVAVTPAAAQTPAAGTPAPHTITVNGTARVEPKPLDKKSNASIKKAVAQARAKAVPLAIADGRARAATLSQLAGIPLGALIAIAEAPASPYIFPGPFGEDGTFGPDEYCGTVRTRIFRRDAQGRRRAVGTRARRLCRIPSYISSNLTMVFSTA
jgi:hypothetical protein